MMSLTRIKSICNLTHIQKSGELILVLCTKTTHCQTSVKQVHQINMTLLENPLLLLQSQKQLLCQSQVHYSKSLGTSLRFVIFKGSLDKKNGMERKEGKAKAMWCKVIVTEAHVSQCSCQQARTCFLNKHSKHTFGMCISTIASFWGWAFREVFRYISDVIFITHSQDALCGDETHASKQ